jgi:hypothetical protein
MQITVKSQTNQKIIKQKKTIFSAHRIRVISDPPRGRVSRERGLPLRLGLADAFPVGLPDATLPPRNASLSSLSVLRETGKCYK